MNASCRPLQVLASSVAALLLVPLGEVKGLPADRLVTSGSAFRHSVDLREETIRKDEATGTYILVEKPRQVVEKSRPVKGPRLKVSTSAPREVANWQPAARTMQELNLQRAGYTPYDRYLGVVRSVMKTLDTATPSMTLACQLMREGRNFDYESTDPYRAEMPTLTATRRAGDCKSKALWLYEKLGDASALYVIGKAVRGAKTSHAWVYWRNEGRWWILDCTNRFEPIAAESVSNDRYIPYYSFSKAGSFRHSATRLLLPGEPIATRAAVVAARPSGTSSSRKIASRR